jgi:excisionase family DNA binding protein
VADVAERYQVSPRTVLRWVARNDLHAVRLPGGRLRIRVADLDAAEADWATQAHGRMLADTTTDGGQSCKPGQ